MKSWIAISRVVVGAAAVFAGAAVVLMAQGGPHLGRPLPTFATADFSGSGTCASCHSSLTDTTGQDVSIDAHWRSTMMANSARDPLWQAKVSAEVARTPALKAAIEAKCATCHTPMARTQAMTDGSPVTLFDGGFFDRAHPLHPAAVDGVSCTLCHQVQPAELGQPASFSGGYRIDTTTGAPSRLAFGPFVAPLLNPMRNMSGFTPVEGAQTRDAGLCATCHTLYTPTVDAAGDVVGQLPEQTPYLEWRHSSFGDGAGEDRSCQQCHMPEAAGPAVISNRPGGWQLSPRSPFGQHQFVGGNSFMLRMIKANADELALTASTDHLDATIRRTADQLESKTARLSIAESSLQGRSLTVVLDVASLTGHKLPTGFPSRRAWLHVTVEDAAARVVFESGRPQHDGSIAGNAADEAAGGLERHYDRITEPHEVQIYEAVMQDTDGAVTYTLLRGARYAKDNRLLPAGFVPATAHADVAVYGEAAFDHNFTGGSDRVTFVVDLKEASGPFTVNAELLYQSASYRFVQDLRGVVNETVERYGRFHDAADKTPGMVASVRTTVHQ